MIKLRLCMIMAYLGLLVDANVSVAGRAPPKGFSGTLQGCRLAQSLWLIRGRMLREKNNCVWKLRLREIYISPGASR